ncbi:MAG TPA: glycosyltransferase [bacterium]|jgi:hypothetical protein|nr:glycosyltransferase [bacterium]HNZ51240.1 glycosyltransferase [bacterium]HOF79723.1 glycosyltransferase [bacterium]HOH85135.1 glycosyltransferase [bacterium]HOQ91551.1 glycosyltransferase [bacterium]
MSGNKRITLDLCLPVYNEAAILASNVQRIVDFISSNQLAVDCRLIILVNGSTDQSLQIAQELSQRWPNLVSYKNYEVASRGSALLAYADISPADWWGFMDIDLAVDLASLQQFFKLMVDQSADVLLASRLMPQSSYKHKLTRKIISVVYNQLARFALKTSVKDHQCGFKFISQSWWKTLRPYLQDSRWFLDTEIIAWTTKLGGRIVEIPVDWVNNRYHIRPTKIKLIRDISNFLINLYCLRKRLRAHRSS